jgi:hypothetical protein
MFCWPEDPARSDRREIFNDAGDGEQSGTTDFTGT